MSFFLVSSWWYYYRGITTNFILAFIVSKKNMYIA